MTQAGVEAIADIVDLARKSRRSVVIGRGQRIAVGSHAVFARLLRSHAAAVAGRVVAPFDTTVVTRLPDQGEGRAESAGLEAAEAGSEVGIFHSDLCAPFRGETIGGGGVDRIGIVDQIATAHPIGGADVG